MEEEPQEKSDLLSANKRALIRNVNSVLETAEENENTGPPDGGLRAYLIVIGSFLTNGLLFGVINSYSVIYTVLDKQLKDGGDENSESRASLVGSLAMGTTFFLSPLSGVLTSLLGMRLTAVLGGLIATTGLLLSSFAVDYVDVLCITYGVMYGLGASLAYTPSLAILGHYFKKYLGLVNGLVTIGSSVFTVIMPLLMTHVIKNHGLQGMFRVLAICTFGIALCGLLFVPISLTIIEKPLRQEGVKALIKTIVNVEIWKNRKYRLWALSMPVALFGYFVPYIYIEKFIDNRFSDVKIVSLQMQTKIPLQCIAFTSGIGRLIFGLLADRRGIDRIYLQQISFYVIGTLTIVLAFIPGTIPSSSPKDFVLLILITLGMGLFDGAFIALIGPIAFELCGEANAAQAIGCMLGLAATPIAIGPPIAGKLYSKYGSYTVPFILAGISPLVGATMMFTIRLYGNRPTKAAASANGHVSGSRQPDVENENILPIRMHEESSQRTPL